MGPRPLYIFFIHLYTSETAGAVVQWLKLPAWQVENRGLEPCSGIQVSKKQNVSSPLTRNDSILWGASVSEK